MRPNRLREIWAAGKAAANCWLTLPGALAAEMLAHQGWDSLTVDLQHGHSDFAAMCAMFTAISTTATVPLVRVPWNEPGDIMRALDAGAYGVICPNIESVDDAQRFVGAARYAPLGFRSVGPKRGLLYGGPDYLERANDTVLAIAQVESAAGLANVDAIAAVPGLDMLYVGPADLALSMGRPPKQNSDDAVVMAAVDRILAAAKKAGLAAGMHCTGPDYALAMIAKGFDLVTVTSDETLLAAGKSAIVATQQIQRRR
jgi:4-hydroxy-2-oxoheptanedioate aldolase